MLLGIFFRLQEVNEDYARWLQQSGDQGAEVSRIALCKDFGRNQNRIEAIRAIMPIRSLHIKMKGFKSAVWLSKTLLSD